MKNKTLMKTLSALLAVVMVLCSAPLSGFVGLKFPEIKLSNWSLFDFGVKAEANSYSGTCGENVTWTLDVDSGELNIEGYGNMQSFNQYQSPWYVYRENIRKVTIDDRITSIGSFSFTNCTGINDITIPEKVTSIGSWAFKGCTNLSIVTFLGNKVTLIADYAFSECYSLHSFTIPESVTTLYEDAFYNCGLEYIHIPKNLTRMDARPFSACSNLLGITVDADNPNFSNDIYGILYNKDKTVLIQYPCNKEFECFAIPEGVETIRGCAFEKSQNLQTIILPDSVKNISGFAFMEMPQLKSIVLSKAITEIPYMCFTDCKKLKEIFIPSSIDKIDSHAFLNCDMLENVYFDGTYTEWNDISFSINNGSLFNATIHYNYDPISHYVAVIIPPTCTEQGYTTYTCECGDSYFDDYVDATGHSYTSEITTPATHTSTGILTYTCECGDTYTETIDKITTHKYLATVTDPTCTEQGYTTYTCECGNTYIDDYVPALGKVNEVSIPDITLIYKTADTIEPDINIDDGVNYTTEYSSSNPSVLVVDKNGNITSIGGTGEVIITITVTDEYGNVVEDSCKVTVSYQWWQWLIIIFFFGWIWY